MSDSLKDCWISAALTPGRSITSRFDSNSCHVKPRR
jgi:hypothetical protein